MNKLKRIAVFAATSLILIAGIIYHFFFSMSALPDGELIGEYPNSDRTRTVKIYLCGGNATTDFAIKGKIFENNNGKEKTIYWTYHESEANVQWLDDENIKINGKTLNTCRDVYDYRREIST